MNYFENYHTKEDYLADGLRYIEPMTAQEIKDENKLAKIMTNPGWIAEEKFDGVRCTLHFNKGKIRAFSRRESKKTGWFVENSDLLPHIRDFANEADGTILDGELYIPGRPFIDASSTMNCKPEKAIARQKELGKVYMKVFDMLVMGNKDIRHHTLGLRKIWLKDVLKELNCPYLEEVEYVRCDKPTSAMDYLTAIWDRGGEGIILKDLDAIYESKRSKAFIKVKRHSTWDCVIMGYSDPVKEYTGKDLANWPYVIDGVAVTKHYYMGWIGTIRFGVYKDGVLTEVGECSGFDEKYRRYFSEYKDLCLGMVIEVKAQEIIEKTGRLRHPVFERIRTDVNAESCTWAKHMGIK